MNNYQWSRERPTPHKLALCVALHLYVAPHESDLQEYHELQASPNDEGGVRRPRICHRTVQRLLRWLLRSVQRVNEPTEWPLAKTVADLLHYISHPRSIDALRSMKGWDVARDQSHRRAAIELATAANGNGNARAAAPEQGGEDKCKGTPVEEWCFKTLEALMVGEYIIAKLEAIESPDHLFDLLESCKDLLVLPTFQAAKSSNEISRIWGDPDINGSPDHIDPGSIFGMYLRRFLLSADQLLFDGLSRLFDELQSYIAQFRTIQQQQQQQQQLQQQQQQEQLELPKESSRFYCSRLSPRQMQLHLHRRAAEIERSIGVISPQDTEREIQAMLSIWPDLPRAHYLRYLNNLHHGECQGAIDSLHRYFDYCLRPGGPGPANQNRLPGDGGTGDTGGGSGGLRTQYAVLNLAGLHFRFGNIDEALQAIRETVRVAQQNNDHACVAHALAWLFRVQQHAEEGSPALFPDHHPSSTTNANMCNKEEGGGSGSISSPAFSSPTSLVGMGPQAQQLLQRCLRRSTELRLPHLEALTALAGAQEALFSPPGAVVGSESSVSAVPNVAIGSGSAGSAGSGSRSLPPPRSRPQRVWSTLRRSVSASTRSGETKNGASASQRRKQQQGQGEEDAPNVPKAQQATPLVQAIRSQLSNGSACDDALASVLGRGHLLRATAWSMFGVRQLSGLSASTHLHCYSLHGPKPHSTVADTCLALCTLADTRAHFMDTSTTVDTTNTANGGAAGGGGGGGSGSAATEGGSAICVDRDLYANALNVLLELRAHVNRQDNNSACSDGNKGGGGVGAKAHQSASSSAASSASAVGTVGVHRSLWPRALCLLLQEWAVARGESRRALQLSSQLCALSWPSPDGCGTDGGSAFAGAALRHISSVLGRGSGDGGAAGVAHLRRAYRSSHAVLGYCTGTGDRLCAQRAGAMLAIANVFTHCSRACSGAEGITGAVPWLLRCEAYAEGMQMSSTRAATALGLVEAHMRLGHARMASRLLHTALPVVLAHCPVVMQGHAHMLEAKCALARFIQQYGQQHQQQQPRDGRQEAERGALAAALNALSVALTCYEAAQGMEGLREVFYLKARLHHRSMVCCGDRVGAQSQEHRGKRDASARMFLALQSTIHAAQATGSSGDRCSGGMRAGGRCAVTPAEQLQQHQQQAGVDYNYTHPSPVASLAFGHCNQALEEEARSQGTVRGLYRHVYTTAAAAVRAAAADSAVAAV